MEGIILLAAAVGLIIFLYKKRKRKRFKLKPESVPTSLGILNPSDKDIVKLLHSSISSAYASQLKNRLLLHNPEWKDHDFDWRYFELKRYFILNSLLKTVPMFSERVDEIWHEMLMFTKEYEKFTHKFYKGFLHHTPNSDTSPIPGERAFFDWVYLSLFQGTVNSRILWGGFLKYPIKKEILEDFKNLSEDELLNRYFRNTDEWRHIQINLINKMKAEIAQAESVVMNKEKYSNPIIDREKEYYKVLPAAVFFSLYASDAFTANMNKLIDIQHAKAAAASSGGSSCSGYGCSSGCSSSSDSDSGGGSSCSSCGGGCS